MYIYIYSYLYLYNLLFSYFKLLPWMCEWVVEAWGGPRRATVWDTNTGRAVLTSYGSSWRLITHHAYDPGFSKRTHKDSMQPCPPHSHTASTIETNRKKRAWLRNVSPLDVQLSVEHPPLPDSHPPSRGAGRVCVCASSPSQGASASKANFCPCAFFRTQPTISKWVNKKKTY